MEKNNKIKTIASILLFVFVTLIMIASSIMLYFDYPSIMLCNIITPSMGYRDLPLIYPTNNGILGSLVISFTTTTTPTGSICSTIEPFTPTVKIIGDILSGAPAYIHGLVCPHSTYNYSAFAHLISGPYTEKRAYTDKHHTILHQIIKRTATAKLLITENQKGDINIYIGQNQICISGKIQTSPENIMSTVSALLGIPYPIWGKQPDWQVLSQYYNKYDLILMKARYLELIGYRAEYLSLLNNKPTDYTEYFIIPYLYIKEHLTSKAEQTIANNINTLKQNIDHMIKIYQLRQRRRRLLSFLLFGGIFLLIVLSFPWESLTGLIGSLSIIALSPGIEAQLIWSLTLLIALIIILFVKFLIKKDVAITLGVMATFLFIPTALSITWLGIIPTFREPSAFMSHLIKLTIPATLLTSLLYTIIIILQQFRPSTAQENFQDQSSEP